LIWSSFNNFQPIWSKSLSFFRLESILRGYCKPEIGTIAVFSSIEKISKPLISRFEHTLNHPKPTFDHKNL
jgi:hypothetical protein